MVIGVPREVKGQEYRVALLPSAAYQLCRRGHEVIVEYGAGAGAGYADADYQQAGAKLVRDYAEVFDRAQMIVKVKEPQPSEYELLKPGTILFTYLHLAASKSLTEALMKSGVTGLAYETIEVNRRLPLLEPMSEIAGRMSILSSVRNAKNSALQSSRVGRVAIMAETGGMESFPCALMVRRLQRD